MPTAGQTPTRDLSADSAEIAALRLLAKECPTPAALVSPRFEWIRGFGDLSPFLEIRETGPSGGIAAMARGALRSALRSGLERAVREGRPVAIRGVEVEGATTPDRVDLRIEALPASEGASPGLMVFFESPRTSTQAATAPRAAPPEHGAAGLEALEERFANTERELASRDAELAQARQLLHEAREEFDEFATIASHDLKAPLRGIATYCQILLKRHAEQLDADGLERLSALPQLAQRAQDLLNALHRYAEFSRNEFEVATVVADEVVAEALEGLGLAEGEHGDTSICVSRPLPTVDCDRNALRTIFESLVTNALQYNESEPRRVTIGALADSHPPTFFVQDNGIGISETLREAVFQIFRRLHPADAFEGGSGAGLAIARKLIEGHGGRIWVESAPGEGSRFCFDLGKSSG